MLVIIPCMQVKHGLMAICIVDRDMFSVSNYPMHAGRVWVDGYM